MGTTTVFPDQARSRLHPPRSERVVIRLTRAERARLELGAAQVGVTLSEWFRAALARLDNPPNDNATPAQGGASSTSTADGTRSEHSQDS